MLLLKLEDFERSNHALHVGSRRIVLNSLAQDTLAKLDPGDGTESRTYLLDTSGFEENATDGPKSVLIDKADTPLKPRESYLLLRGAEFAFVDGPFRFVPRASLRVTAERRFPFRLRSGEAYPENGGEMHVVDLAQENAEVRYEGQGALSGIELRIGIPCLRWRLGGGAWRTDCPNGEPFWHAEFTGILRIHDPEAVRMTLEMDDERRTRVEGEPSRSESCFLFDLDRFRDPLLRQRGTFGIALVLETERETIRLGFAKVVNRNYAYLVQRTQDCEEGCLQGRFEIVGRNPCFLTVTREGETKPRLESVRLVDGAFRAEGRLSKGRYRFVLREQVADAMGFGSQSYVVFDEMESIDDRNDLTGRSLEILSFDWNGRLEEIRSHRLVLTSRESKDRYHGTLTREPFGSANERKETFGCEIAFPQPNDLVISEICVFDGDEYVPFIFCVPHRVLLKSEPKGLPGWRKYRDYVLLEPDTRFRIRWTGGTPR